MRRRKMARLSWLLLATMLAAAIACGGSGKEATPAPPPPPQGPPEEATVPPVATPAPDEKAVKIGAWVEVFQTDACLNVRAGPGLSQPVVACVPDGSLGLLRD